MKRIMNIKMHSVATFVLLIGFLGINPPEAKSCVDPETLISVGVNYSADLTDIAIVLGNLKFMEEEPNVFCSCALSSYTDFFTNLEYVAFVEAGTTTPYPNMEPWTNTTAADDAWEAAYPGSGDWSGFIAEVINSGLGPDDDVELVIRASIPDGYFVTISDMDTILVLSQLGTDAWDPVSETLIADHQEVRNLGYDNTGATYLEVSDDYFTNLDEGILASIEIPENSFAFDLSPNPNNGSFLLRYNLEVSTSVAIHLRDVTGRLVYSNPAEQQSDGQQEIRIDIPQGLLENGLYIVEVVSDRQAGYQKIVLTN